MRMAAIYARVSSEQQREANTIASQTASLIEFAKNHDLEVPQEWVFEDEGYSGGQGQFEHDHHSIASTHLGQQHLQAFLELLRRGRTEQVVAADLQQHQSRFVADALGLH